VGARPSASDLQTFANALITLYDNHALGVMTGQVTFAGVEITDLSAPTAAQVIVTANNAGASGNQYLSADDAVLINFEVLRRYRGGKPRQYWPWGSFSDLANPQQWLQASITNFTSRWAQIESGILATPLGAGATIASLCSISYYQGVNPPITLPSGRVKQSSALRPGGPIIDDVVATTVNQTLGSQRRRMRPG
jgi:hypothetical protein